MTFTPDVARARTLAASGTEIIAWLAEDEDSATEDVADAAESWLAAAAPPGDS